MKNRIILTTVMIVIVFTLSGCVSGKRIENTNDTENQMLLNSGSCFVYTFKDSKTGVWYIATNHGICPRYNSDGSLYVTE